MAPLRRFARELRPELPAFARAFALMGVLALATGAYAFLVGPALRYVFTGGREGLGELTRAVPAIGPALDAASLGTALPALLVAAAIVKGAAYLAQFRAMGMIGQRVVARLRREILARLLALGPSYLSRHHSGDLVARFASDVDHVERAATYALASLLRDTLQVAVLLGLAVALDWRLSVVAFGALPLAALAVSRFARRLRGHAQTTQTAVGRLTAIVSDALAGIRGVQAYDLGPAQLRRFDAEAARGLTAQRRAVRLRAATSAALELVAVCGLAAAVALAARAVEGGESSPERLLSFAAAVALVVQPARDLGRVGPLLVAASASLERVYAVLDAAPAVTGGRRSGVRLERAIAFEGVTFGYDGAPVLDRIDFRIARAERVALVGASGAGKSTIAALLLRFYDPAAGRITLDGVDLRELTLDDARRNFALVTQEPLLFDDTVAANLRLARPEATDAEIRRAASAARADGFIEALPQGYETWVGEQGVRLSGGERQRLALARAILSGAPVLVLDEATSNLDEASQREVQRALDDVLAGRTALLIAHRLSSVRGVDRILVLKDGRIVEEGRHDDLFARGGEYRRLYEGVAIPARFEEGS